MSTYCAEYKKVKKEVRVEVYDVLDRTMPWRDKVRWGKNADGKWSERRKGIDGGADWSRKLRGKINKEMWMWWREWEAMDKREMYLFFSNYKCLVETTRMFV